MDMSETNSGLADIIEPAAPVLVAVDGRLWIALLITGLVIVAAVLFVLWKYKLPAYRAIRRMRALHKQLHDKENTPLETVLLLALELRHGLGVKQLSADKIPEQFKQHDHSRWTDFLQTLDTFLYQHNAELSAEKLADLFAQAEYWLRHYGRKSVFKKIGI